MLAVEVPFMSEGMTYKRDEWRAEHERDTWAARVRFVVTFAYAADDIKATIERWLPRDRQGRPLRAARAE